MSWLWWETNKLALDMSYMEIYQEKVYDLLRPSTADLQIREDAQKGIFIAGLSQLPVTSVETFRALYEQGCKNRTTAATLLNSTSSRSHAVLVFKVECRDVHCLIHANRSSARNEKRRIEYFRRSCT